MKKSFLVLVLAVVAVFSASAVTVDELAGIWQSKSYTVPGEEGMKMSAQDKYTFTKDGEAAAVSELTMTIMLDEHIYADLYITGKFSGTFTVDDSTVTINIDKSTASFSLDEDKINIRGIDDAAMADQMRTALAGQFGGFVNMMSMTVPESTTLTDVKVDGKKMTCVDEGTNLTFSRKKK